MLTQTSGRYLIVKWMSKYMYLINDSPAILYNVYI